MHNSERANQGSQTVRYLKVVRNTARRSFGGAKAVARQTAEKQPATSGLLVFASGCLLGLFAAGRRKRVSVAAIAEFIDKCTARWLFEKTGVQLYDEAIVKCPPPIRARLVEIRNEKRKHEELLEKVIRNYAADPHAVTKSMRITRIESEGIVAVVQNENFPAVIDALLAAELVDNVNWDLLAKLAGAVGDEQAQELFEDALRDETRHLCFIRDLVFRETLRRVK